MDGKVTAGVVATMCELLEQQYGVPRAKLLDAAALDESDVRDPYTRLPSDALTDLFLCIREHTGDPASGMHIGLALAQWLDLRTQGFGGYALLSSTTLRQRIELHIRYEPLYFPTELKLSVEGDVAALETTLHCSSLEGKVLLMDSIIACCLLRFQRFFGGRKIPLALWLDQAEKPHHREMRALMPGPMVFGAAVNRLEFPARELDLSMAGDPYLYKLACDELDARVEQVSELARGDIVNEVRQRVTARLASDASVTRVARDLRLSARSLQRYLGALGASFQQLVEEVRHKHAVAYLVETDEAIEQIASRLGYGDASNFRRAFRRWTGQAPALFRAARRAQAEARGSARERRGDE